MEKDIRVFLNWDVPLLKRTAEFFIEDVRFIKNSTLDMRDVIIAATGNTAKKRLLELLAEKAETLANPAWHPPEIITFGQLTDRFYKQKLPFADKLTQIFTWVNAIQNISSTTPEVADYLPPVPDDTEGQYRLGSMFVKLHDELAEDVLDFGKVADKCRELKIYGEEQRWKMLAAIQLEYLKILDGLNLWDRLEAIRFAIEKQTGEERSEVKKRFAGKQIFLLGVTDMNQFQKKILDNFWIFITPLVFAPDTREYRETFDKYGCIRPQKWADEPLEITDSQIVVAADEHEQADAVMLTLNELKEKDAALSPSEILIGIPDTKLLPFIEQRFERAGMKTDYVKELPFQRTRVYRFLEILAGFLSEPDGKVPYQAFAELLRHPDVRKVLTVDGHPPNLKELDEFHENHLPSFFDNLYWQQIEDILDGDKTSEERDKCAARHLHAVWRQIDSLIPKTGTAAERLQKILDEFFPNPIWITAEACGIVKEAIQKIEQFSSRSAAADLNQSAADFLKLLLLQTANEFISPQDALTDKIELKGWLDIPMNDAPAVIITGMNDGTVPSYVLSDMFLPDNLRSKLGIDDNRRRIARDVYNLTVILKTRSTEKVKLIAGRRFGEDAQLPSRLFFAAQNTETVCRRVADFFKSGEKRKPQPSVYFPNEILPAEEHRFEVPEPKPLKPEKEFAMSVTSFKKYKEDKYRFYLSQILGLKHLNDNSTELPPFSFGNLLHRVLEEFGKNEKIKNSDNADAIKKHVWKTLEQVAEARFGSNPAPAVRIQIAMAEQRLEVFAGQQAEWRKDGWEIIDTEFSVAVEDGIILGGLPLKGRIDRIDKRTVNGKTEYMILDYKSSETAKKPDEEHRQKKKDGVKDEKEWLDFQLPLYYYLVHQDLANRKRICGGNDTVLLGYWALPKDEDGGVQWADKWSADEIQSAIDECAEIAAEIKNAAVSGDFSVFKFDPNGTPKYDEFPEICLRTAAKEKW